MKTWDFLEQFSHPTDTPDHLSLSIDAVSLAYLSHQVYSEAALTGARERYVSALRSTNKALQCTKSAATDTTLISSLILDLYEKITNVEPQGDKSWTSHVNGALAIVNFRGLSKFQDNSGLKVLGRLSINLLISCVVSGAEVPTDLNIVRAYCGKFLDVNDPKWQLSDLMVSYASVCNQIRKGQFSVEQQISLTKELDSRHQAFAFNMPLEWRFQTIYATISDQERVWGKRIDKYADRHVTQTWNVSRLVRILLNESILEYCTTSPHRMMLEEMAKRNIKVLAEDICASAPQYLHLRCELVARRPTAEVNFQETAHIHTPAENLDCYILLFPLYVVGQSNYVAPEVKVWIIRQMQHMASHFNIRNAELVAQILSRGGEEHPWKIYAMLGSYAFVT
ncbi:hypothetical protein EG329_002366 [Mollisiaceae sp. DMI_Dod_QoI]|nr:hypothetical protein EG329_002366 [Helotiales sp. DMI_Dod_QoI]